MRLSTWVLVMCGLGTMCGVAQADRAAATKLNVAGMKEYNKGHWDEAQARFTEAIAADADFVLPHYNLGSVLSILGEWKAALAEITWLVASPDPEARKKLTKALKDADFDRTSTLPVFRAAIGAPAWDSLDAAARLAERNGTWFAEGSACGSPWVSMTVKASKVTLQTFFACNADQSKTTDTGTAKLAAGTLTITWKKNKKGAISGKSAVSFEPCDDLPDLTCVRLDNFDQQLERGRLSAFFTP